MSSTSIINPESSYYSVSIMLTEHLRKNMFFSFPFTSTLTFNTFEEASSFVERHRSYFDNSFITMKIYECFPVSDFGEEEFFGSKVITDLDKFKEMSDVIVANRKADCLSDVEDKCFSRDLFGDN